ncbi:MAG TPA: hypothetical protein VGB14_13565 [Acidimicrobiales bacterium]
MPDGFDAEIEIASARDIVSNAAVTSSTMKFQDLYAALDVEDLAETYVFRH